MPERGSTSMASLEDGSGFSEMGIATLKPGEAAVVNRDQQGLVIPNFVWVGDRFSDNLDLVDPLHPSFLVSLAGIAEAGSVSVVTAKGHNALLFYPPPSSKDLLHRQGQIVIDQFPEYSP